MEKINSHREVAGHGERIDQREAERVAFVEVQAQSSKKLRERHGRRVAKLGLRLLSTPELASEELVLGRKLLVIFP